MGKFRSAKKKTKTTMMHSRIALISAIGVIYLGTVAAGQNDHHRQHDTDDPMRRFVADRVTRRRCFENNAVQLPPRRLLSQAKMVWWYIKMAGACALLCWSAIFCKRHCDHSEQIFRPLKDKQDAEKKLKQEQDAEEKRNFQEQQLKKQKQDERQKKRFAAIKNRNKRNK